MQNMLAEMEESCDKVGVVFQVFDAAGPDEFQNAFEAISKSRHDAVIVFPSPMFYVNYLVEIPMNYQLPTMYVFRDRLGARRSLFAGEADTHIENVG